MMVEIITFPTDEKAQEWEFQPREKYGILVVGKNFYTGFMANVPDFQRWHPLISGNVNLYDWELLMTGTVDFGERSPLNVLGEDVSFYDDKGITRISRVTPKEIVRSFLEVELEAYESGRNRNGNYQEVAKVWPGTSEVLPEFEKAVERFADLSDNDSLTTIVIFSHGEKGSIQMGNAYLPYRKLLEDLDKINGKKAVFVYACHSGSFLKRVRTHPHRENYAVIASCETDNRSTNWNDRQLDNYLFEHFSRGKRYSELTLKPIEGAGHDQHPQMLRYFDVCLIKT